MAALRFGNYIKRMKEVNVMKKNIGAIDRIIRTVLAVAIVVCYFTGSIAGTAAIVLVTVEVILLLTSATGVFPLYGPFSISTLKKST
jgi:hypothetical protein